MINDYQIVSGDASQVIFKYSNLRITSKQGSLRKATWVRQWLRKRPFRKWFILENWYLQNEWLQKAFQIHLAKWLILEVSHFRSYPFANAFVDVIKFKVIIFGKTPLFENGNNFDMLVSYLIVNETYPCVLVYCIYVFFINIFTFLVLSGFGQRCTNWFYRLTMSYASRFWRTNCNGAIRPLRTGWEFSILIRNCVQIRNLIKF